MVHPNQPHETDFATTTVNTTREQQEQQPKVEQNQKCVTCMFRTHRHLFFPH